MHQPQAFPPFKEFVKSLSKRSARALLRRLPKRAKSDLQAEVMRDFLGKYYRQTMADHSFLDKNGQIWDCVPIDRQPSVRRSKRIKVLAPPDYPGDIQLSTIGKMAQLTDDVDPFGNLRKCPDGHVPVKRLTLEKLSEFKTLSEFNKKRSGASSFLASQLIKPEAAESDNSHRYVYVRQSMPNRGGGSILSLWQPPVDPNAGQMLSLSQIWVFGGGGAQLQTVEVGWQVSPSLWGTDDAVLFIYWTADNYSSTGSYNLQGGAFVQTNSHWLLGGSTNPVSTVGGQQFDIITEWFFINSAWWLYLNKQAVGYYPPSLFGSGPMGGHADGIMAGGEVSSNGSWGPMGSGIFAQQGYGESAYVRNAHWMAMDGTQHNMNIAPTVTSPGCYSFVAGANPAWGSSFFYGGPGSGSC